MAWKETCPVQERMKFILDWQSQRYSLAALCREYGISRPTAYKWLKRFRAEGMEGLADRPRAPKHHPNAVSDEIEEAVVAARCRYPHWGPKKLRVFLLRKNPQRPWPACSTIGDILKRRGLVLPRQRRHRTPAYSQPFAGCEESNATWSADFKGWFRTGDGCRVDPLTISDAHSRMLLRCQALRASTADVVRPVFQATFCEYGLPSTIRTDNGPPFATRGIAGLSHLSVWWLKLGIQPERIEPGQPHQNGRHERLHLTLKKQTAQPPCSTLRAQQRAFDRFVQEYNYERPHEALDMATPASVYVSSPRTYPERDPEVEYPRGLVVRKVQKRGEFYWKHQGVFLGEAFIGEPVGLGPLDDRYWLIRFANYPLGVFDSYRTKMLTAKQIDEANLDIEHCLARSLRSASGARQ